MEWPEGTLPWRLPFTLGHETAGTVAALGSRTCGFAEGDRVLVYGPWGCGRCCALRRRSARTSASGARAAGAGCGLGYDGGLAEYVLVPSPRLLVPIGELDPVGAAPLTDAALTPYHAVKRELPRLVPGSAVVVIGVGGLGHVAVQLLRELSPARIVAVDLRERSRRLALDAGRGVALDADGLDGRGRPRGARAAAPRSSSTSSARRDARARRGDARDGRPREPRRDRRRHASRWRSAALPFEWSMSKPSWGTLPELHEVVALARPGRSRDRRRAVRLEEAIDGYRRLRSGDVDGRAVVVP